MYHDTNLYDLAFVPETKQPSKAPELVFICSTAHAVILADRLAILRERQHEAATLYFGGVWQLFSLPDFNRRTKSMFGYNKCGYVTFHECETHFHLPLKGGEARFHTTFTLQLLKIAFMIVEPGDVPLSNRTQQLDIDLCTDKFRPDGYGHAVGGYLSHGVTAWLTAYVVQPSTDTYPNGDAPMLTSVTDAMRATWRRVAGRNLQQFIDDCRGRIFREGAFILECFGNACDVGVYPSEFRTDEPSHSISCHNLDTVEQQLTLLAGLAQLCTLVRNDEQC